MHLQRLSISNFRGLETINVEFGRRVSVIVGPNAIGKTTVLEAIRLTKALLAPRTQQESSQVAIALGAASAHMPQQFMLESIALDSTKPIEIRTRYKLSAAEIDALEDAVPTIATNFVQAQAGMTFALPAALIQFLSSDTGKKAVKEAQEQIQAHLTGLKITKFCDLDLTIDPAGNARGGDGFSQIVASFLEQRQPPSKTNFSYFPADRALPTGETPVQLGAADAAAQLESHNSQAQTKYARLKNTIFAAIAESDESRERLTLEFATIFNSVLSGRKLAGVTINRFGLLSIRVEDVATGRTFDLDSMSSGEKGLILTFLLISRTLAEDGVLLLDEPELHLNPAVCRDILGFLADQYALPKNIQVIVCSHSAEILATALDREDCDLYHLRAADDITRIRVGDQDEAAVALQRLGSSQSESLLYRGTVFVEGPEDADLLEIGFETLLGRHKVKDLGGRAEVEKQIKLLQDAEKQGEEFTRTLFIFDMDRIISEVTSSERVRVIQWKRRCIENYLLDVDVITDLLQSSEIAKKPLHNVGEVSSLLRRLAMKQLVDTAAQDVYNAYGFENPGLRKREIQGKSLEEIAEILFARVKTMKTQMQNIVDPDWKNDFMRRVDEQRAREARHWEDHWVDISDGKRVFADLQREVPLNMGLQRFKRQVMLTMRLKQSEGWALMQELIKNAL